MLALIATPTILSRQIFFCKNAAVVSKSPNKPNITYKVHLNSGTLEETFAHLVEEIKCWRQTTERTIVFSCTYDACGQIHLFLNCRLGKEFTELVGAPDVAQFSMFSACTHSKVKDSILKSFIAPDSGLSRDRYYCIWDGARLP